MSRQGELKGNTETSSLRGTAVGSGKQHQESLLILTQIALSSVMWSEICMT